MNGRTGQADRVVRDPVANRPVHRASQNGVTMVIALVMLVIIGLTSVAVMRSALNTDLGANNGRVQALAFQAAQIGLRYCEGRFNDSGFVIQPAVESGTPGWWQRAASWRGTPKATTVPATSLASGNSSFTPAFLPQCLAEYTEEVPGAGANTVIIVTARGFSPDYAENPVSGHSVSGSVIWLQSINRR
jgi:type IV pilus assembly protein PilX